ncbi:MAG: Ig-like domain-containing protein [Bifidobacteriaceae bacterium]|nr:Ig-like domain-containing protein [Bifidobacteriaceae bacterium]
MATLGGLTFLTDLKAPEVAVATKYQGTWRGIFSPNELYALGSPGSVAYAWDKPWNYATLPRATSIFDRADGNDGDSVAGNWDTFAVGPVFAWARDYTLHGVGWSANTQEPPTLMERDKQTGRLNATSLGPFRGVAGGRPCVGPRSYSGAVDPRTGLVFAVFSQADTRIAANASHHMGTRLSIFRLDRSAYGERTLICVASNGNVLTPASRTIHEAWRAELGQPPFPADDSWTIASDVVADGNGNALLFVTNARNRHALLRVNVPRDASGQPNPDGGFTYEVVKFFTANTSDGSNTGLAIMDSKLYVQEAGKSSRIWRYDLLSGSAEYLGPSGLNGPGDLASAQSVARVQGTVFDDANANSRREPGERGAAGQVIEIWQQVAVPGSSGQRRWKAVGSVATSADGSYSALLPTSNGDVLVRLRQPRLGGVNAAQTYASAGAFSSQNGPSDSVMPLCYRQTKDYQAMTKSGACYGARADGIDPSGVTDPMADQGGAGIVSHVRMRSGLAVPVVDFGITSAGSWGDAPDAYRTTNARLGPYANPRIGADSYLYLGARAGLYVNGQPSPDAGAHATDDSLEIAPIRAGQTDASRAWAPAQGQLMVAGQSYRFRAKASGLAAAVKSAHVKAWITGLTTSGVAAPTMNRPLLGDDTSCSSSPDANGYVYCTHRVEPTAPADGVTPVFARVRVDAHNSFSATSRGPANASKEAWMPKGEIEDYRLGVAAAILRIEARSPGLATNAKLSLSNVAAGGLSSATDTVATDASPTFTRSRTAHALVSRGAATVISTRGVGAANTTALNGWRLGTSPGASPGASPGTSPGEPADSDCVDTATGADLDATVDAAKGVMTVPVPAAGQLPADITCRLTYIPTADPAGSTVVADPMGNSAQSDRLVVSSGTSAVAVKVVGSVPDQSGTSHALPASGQSVSLSLTPMKGTGADLDGAFFEYSTDQGATWTASGKTYACTTDAAGGCASMVRVAATRRGGYSLAASANGRYLTNPATGQPTSASPVQIWFKEGPAASGSIELTDSADKAADYGVAGLGLGDSYELDVEVRDASGNGVTALPDAAFTKTCAAPGGEPATSCPAEAGIAFGAAKEDTAAGRDGHYTVPVYSTRAGQARIGLWVSGVSAALGERGDPDQKYVIATFKPMASIDPAGSIFEVTSTGAKFTSTSNRQASDSYHTGTVRLRDANGNGVTGAVADGKLVWADAGPPPSRVELTEDTAPGREGTYGVKIWADQPGAHTGRRVRFTQADGSSADLAESQNFVFVQPDAAQDQSSMIITADAAQPANHDTPGSSVGVWGSQTVTVTLRDSGADPYTGAVGRLAAASTDLGVYFAAPDGQAGQFACAAAAVAGRCVAGVYTLDVYAGLAGAKAITVAYTGASGTSFQVKTPEGASAVVAMFGAPPADPAASVFVLGDPRSNPGETVPQDDWDDPSDDPDGGDSVTHTTKLPFHLGVRLWDAGRKNPVAGRQVRFTLDSNCPARFAESEGATLTVTSSATGKAAGTVDSGSAGRCAVTAEVDEGGWRPVDGSPKTLTWADSSVDAAASSFTVSRDEVVADGADSGTVTVNLVGSNQTAITTAAGSLVASGPSQGRLTITPFSHSRSVPGEYTAAFSGLTAGDQEIAVEVGGVRLPLADGGNRLAGMVAGPPAAGRSWLIQPSGSVPADGTTSLPIRARLFDANGNPASGPVRFTIPAGTLAKTASGMVAGPDTVELAGVAPQLDLVARVAGTHRVTATVATGVVGATGAAAVGTGVAAAVPVAAAAIATVKNQAETATLREDGKAEAVFVVGAAAPGTSILSIPTAGAAGQTTKLVGGTDKHTAQVAVRDAQGNALGAGATRVVFSWTYPGPAGAVTGSSAPMATDAGGVASFDFGSDVAAAWSMTARLEGAGGDTAGSPQTASFHAGPVDRLKTLDSLAVDSSAKRADGVAQADVRMRAQDQYGNPVAGVPLGFVLDYGAADGPLIGDPATGAKTATVASAQDGWAEVSIASLWPGDFGVRGSYEGVDSGAQQVRFSNVPADPATSRFEIAVGSGGQGDTPVADGRDGYTVTVNLRDSSGAPVNQAGATVVMSPRGIPGAAEVRLPLQSGTAGQGLATAALDTLKAGLWEVSVLIGNDQIGTEADAGAKTIEAPFRPGTPAVGPGASELIAPLSPAKADGAQTQTVTAIVKDANGNPIAGQPVVFAIPQGVTAHPAGSGPTPGPASVTVTTSNSPPGAAELVVVSTKTGSSAITATVAGKRIEAGSPVTAVFVNADLAPAESEFVIPTMPAAKTVATGRHTPQVTLRDASGNLYTPTEPVSFYYKPTAEAAWTAGPVVNTVAGVARWTDFTVEEAGAYDVRANVASGQVPDAKTTRSALFASGPATIAQSTFGASAGAVAPNAPVAHEVTVAVRDAFGNPVAGEPVTLVLPAGDAARFTTDGCDPKRCTIDSTATGLVSVSVASPSAVVTHVIATIGANAVLGEADLAFEAGAADAAHSTWEIAPAGPVVADARAAYTATVQVNDSNDAAKADGVVTFSIPPEVTITEAPPHRADRSGRLTVHLTSAKAGTYTVGARIGTADIGQADRKLVFKAGPISDDPARTRLTGPPSDARADGARTQVVTATVADAQGNPVVGAMVRFAVPDGTALAPGASAEAPVDADGQARLELVATAAGRYEVTAQAKPDAGGVYQAIAGGSPVAVNFVAGPVAPAESAVSRTSAGAAAADGKAAHVVKTELKDRHGNPVAGAAVTVTIRLYDAAGSAPVPGVAPIVRELVTAADGSATTDFATTVAGRWQATASTGAGPVAHGAQAVLVFQPLAASPGTSTFDVTNDNVLADGAANHSAWVIVTDANGNPVPGAGVKFAVEPRAPGAPGPVMDPANGVVEACDPRAPGAPAWCDQPGKAQVAIKSSEPGSFKVSASVGGTVVARAPESVSFDSGPPDPEQSSYTLRPDTAGGPQVSMDASGDPRHAYTLTAEVRSPAGILVPAARLRLTGLDAAKVSILEADGASGLTGAPGSAGYGAHTWHLYSATAGSFTGRLEVDIGADQWRPIGPDPFTLRFNASIASAADSWLVQPDGSAQATGAATLEAKVHVRDVNGNDVNTGQVVFDVPDGLTAEVGGKDTPGAPGATVAAPVVQGFATVLYKSVVAGVYAIRAKAEGNDVSTVKDAREDASLTTNGQVKLEIGPGPAASDKSVLTVPTASGGATKVADSAQRHRAEVVVRDAFDNLVPGAWVMFRYGPDEERLTEATVRADSQGRASVEFASSAIARFTVRAQVGGLPVDGSPSTAAFVAGPLDLERTLASFEVQDSSALATGAHPLSVRMRAQDASGNPVAGASLGFRLTAPGDGPVFAPLASGGKDHSGLSDADGYLAAEVVSVFEGSFPLIGLAGSDQSAASDVIFTTNAPAAARSWFTVTRDPGTAATAVADGADFYRVTVNLRDAAGQPVNGVQATINVTGAGGTAGGGAAGGTGVAGAAGSTGVAGGAGAQGIGAGQHLVTSGLVDGQSGTGSQLITSTVAGSFTATAEVAGDRIALGAADAPDKTATLVFEPGPPSSAASYLVGPEAGPARADGNERQVTRAVVRDAQSNPVPGASVVFTVPQDVTAVTEPGGKEVPGPASITVTAGPTGHAEVVLISKVEGTYDISVKIDAASIGSGSPVQAVFTNADVSADRSVLTIPTAGQVKPVRTGFHRPTVELLDASGNAYTDASVPVTFQWRPSGTSAWTGSEVVASTAGRAEWPDWTVSVVGTYEVVASIPSGQVGGVLRARFGPGPAVPMASVFASSAGTVVLNDETATHFVQVTVLDAVTDGNPVPDQAVTFTVTGSARIVGAPAPGSSATVASSAVGVARIEVADATGETVKAAATVDGAQVGSADLEFSPAAVDADRSSWSVSPSTPLTGGHPAVVADGADSWRASVTVIDTLGKPMPDNAVWFDLPTPVSITGAGPHKTDAAGKLSVNLTATAAGSYSVRAYVGAAAIGPLAATIVFEAGAPASDVSYLESPGWSARADGQESLPVRAYVLDANSNPVPRARVRFAIPADVAVVGQSEPVEQVDVPVDPATGRAEIAVTSTKAAAYQVSASAQADGQSSWTPIEKDAPAAAKFVPGPISGPASQVSRSPASPVRLGPAVEPYLVLATLRDALGNDLRQPGVPIQYRFFARGDPSDTEAFCRQTPDASTRFASALTDSDGVATVPFASTLAAPWHGCAYHAGDSLIIGSPVELSYLTGPVDLARTDLEVSQNLALADGSAGHYATVVARDGHGNPAGGIDLVFRIDPGSPGLPGPNVKGGQAAEVTVTTCDPAEQAGAPAWCTSGGVFQAGLARAEFTSEEPGTFAVNATVGGAPVDGSPKVVSFTAGSADAAASARVVDSAPPGPGSGASPGGGPGGVVASGDPGDWYEVTVTALSTAKLAVPGARVRIVGLPGPVALDGPSEALTGTPTVGEHGRHSWRLGSKTAGEFHGRVQVWDGAWADVGAPFRVRFVGGAAVPARSWLVEPSSGALADGTTEVAVVARLRDLGDNPASGGTVAFSVPAGLTALASVGGVPVEGPAEVDVAAVGGTATLRLTSAKAGAHTVTAALETANGSAIELVRDEGGGIVREDGKVVVRFNSGRPAGPESRLSVPTEAVPRVAGAEAHQAVVQILDTRGNPVAGVPVTIQVAEGSGSAPGSVPWTTIAAGRSDQDGLASASVGAPGNRSGWVWIRAFAQADGVPVAIGPDQGDPDHRQTLKRARFVAGPASVEGTADTFETLGSAVLNDSEEQSWARVVVQDAHGNGVPGVEVAFEVPADQPGTAGTPVFVDGFASPLAKTLTVTTCGAEPVPARPECRLDGVHTPGLALARLVSDFEGTFPVTARIADGALSVALGPGDVTFAAGAPLASASSFTLVKTDPASEAVVADGIGSHTLTVTVMNGLTGSAAKPVSGQCVTPQLPDGVSVGSGAAAGTCPAGSYQTDLAGRVSVPVVSTVAGWAYVGADLGGSPIGTEAGGSEYSRAALFVGGPPAGSRSELTSPPAPVPADDPAGLAVTARLRDAHGNAASCWDGSSQVQCAVQLSVPAGAWVGHGADRVTGPAVVTASADSVFYGPAAPMGRPGELRPPVGGGGVAVTLGGAEGVYEVTGRVNGQDIAVADGATATTGPASARLRFTKGEGPDQSASASASASASPGSVASSGGSASAAASAPPGAIPSASASATPSASASSDRSATPSASASPSPTSFATASAAPGATASASATPSASPAASAASPSPTTSASASPSSGGSASAAASASPGATASASASATPSASARLNPPIWLSPLGPNGWPEPSSGPSSSFASDNSPSPSANKPGGGLPFTGAHAAASLVLDAVGLLLFGAGLRAWARRRHKRGDDHAV